MMTARIALHAILAAGLSVAADPREEVSNAEKAVAAARAANDASALDRLTADDFIWVRPTGAVTGRRSFSTT
jgi:ketosteroid isomerase-like protein